MPQTSEPSDSKLKVDHPDLSHCRPEHYTTNSGEVYAIPSKQSIFHHDAISIQATAQAPAVEFGKGHNGLSTLRTDEELPCNDSGDVGMGDVSHSNLLSNISQQPQWQAEGFELGQEDRLNPHKSSPERVNPNVEGVAEPDNYYGIARPDNPNQIQEAQRFQPGANPCLNILQSSSGEAYCQPAGFQTSDMYQYAYGHVPAGGFVIVSNESPQGSSEGAVYAEIDDGGNRVTEEEKTLMQDNDTYV